MHEPGATQPATLEIYRQYGIRYRTAAQQLSASKKLKPDWLVTSGDGGIQFFRSNWFNDEGGGIHFETWMKKSYHEEGRMPFVLHIEAGKSRAGFGQKDLARTFLERCGPGLAENGYKLNPACAMEPMKCFREFTPDTFTNVVVAEFLMLSAYGPLIDSMIQELKS